jgi:hypothetical protein
MLNQKKKLIAFGLLGLVALVWAGAAAALALFEPSIAQWTLIVTAAALATEGAMWVGAVLLGIEAIRRLRARIWLRRAR